MNTHLWESSAFHYFISYGKNYTKLWFIVKQGAIMKNTFFTVFRRRKKQEPFSKCIDHSLYIIM